MFSDQQQFLRPAQDMPGSVELHLSFSSEVYLSCGPNGALSFYDHSGVCYCAQISEKEIPRAFLLAHFGKDSRGRLIGPCPCQEHASATASISHIQLVTGRFYAVRSRAELWLETCWNVADGVERNSVSQTFMRCDSTTASLAAIQKRSVTSSSVLKRLQNAPRGETHTLLSTSDFMRSAITDRCTFGGFILSPVRYDVIDPFFIPHSALPLILHQMLHDLTYDVSWERNDNPPPGEIVFVR